MGRANVPPGPPFMGGGQYKKFLKIKCNQSYFSNILKDLQNFFGHPCNKRMQYVNTIDKVYIDGPCGSKTLAGVLLARFERVSHVTYFKKWTNRNSAYAV